MDDTIRAALEKDQLIDITTTGRVTGKPHKIEIWLHYLGEDDIYLTGRPRPKQRDWYRNMVANPQIGFHLKQSMQADLPATATPITDPAQRRAVLGRILPTIDQPMSDLDQWVAMSPLVRLTLD